MISDYVRRLRERVGSDLLLLPSVAVVPRDAEGRLLLVRQADSGRWGTVGGAIEVDESPAEAATREAKEETGVDVELVRIIDCVGGRGFRTRYANGDEVAYVSIVYEARIASGDPTPDDHEVLEVGWFAASELEVLDLTEFNAELLRVTGFLAPSSG